MNTITTNKSINAAFTIVLSINAISDLLQNQDDYDLGFFEYALDQLRWVAKEQKVIINNILPCAPSYSVLLKSNSLEIEAQTTDIIMSLTKWMLAKNMRRDELKTKSYLLRKSVQRFYSSIKKIEEDLRV